MRIENDKILHLVRAVGDLDSHQIVDDVRSLLSQGLKPERIRESLDVGMKLVGEYFRSGEYFLADLLYAGRLYKETLLLGGMHAPEAGPNVALLGDVPGDTHDVLKDIVACILKATDFEVVDLPSDSRLESYERAVETYDPRLVIISCTQSSSTESLESVIQSIRKRGRGDARIVIQGPCVHAQGYRVVGADSYCKDAMDGLELCLSFV